MNSTLLKACLCLLLCMTAACQRNSTSVDVSNAPKASPTATTNSSTAAEDPLKNVKDAECRTYLTTIKKLSTCQSITEEQRKSFSESYNKLLESSSKSLSDESARQLRVMVCKQSNSAMQTLLAKCNK